MRFASEELCSTGQYGHFNLKTNKAININTMYYSEHNFFLYLLEVPSLLKASFDIICPQMSFIGGLVSELCCLRIGHANNEWYLFSESKSISI